MTAPEKKPPLLPKKPARKVPAEPLELARAVAKKAGRRSLNRVDSVRVAKLAAMETDPPPHTEEE